MNVGTNRWLVLGLLFLVGLTSPMQFQAVAALAPFLIADAGLTYTDIGVLTGLFMLPGIFLAAPSGLLSARIGDRLTLVIGMAMTAVGALAFAMTDSYAVMFASRLLGGVGSVAVAVLLPKVVTDWFAGREIATAMAIIASSVGFGMGLSMAILPVIASPTSWQFAMIVNAGFAAIGIMLLLVIYRDAAPQDAGSAAPASVAPSAPAASSVGSALLSRISRAELVLAALAGVGRGLFSAGYAVFMSFLPALLIAQGMAAVDAGLLTSVAALVSLASVPLGGYLSDRTGKPGYFIVGGSIGTMLACVLVPYIAPAILWIVLFGALRGGCTGGLMALPSRVLRPASRSVGFAVVSAMYFVCMSVFPPIGGYLLDATGNTAAPMWFAGLLWFLITVLLAVFQMLQRKWIG